MADAGKDTKAEDRFVGSSDAGPHLCRLHRIEVADPAALGIAARVAARGHDDCERHLRRPVQPHVCQPALARRLSRTVEQLYRNYKMEFLEHPRAAASSAAPFCLPDPRHCLKERGLKTFPIAAWPCIAVIVQEHQG